MREKSGTNRITHDGQTLTLQQWSTLTGIPAITIYWRLKQRWTVERILGTEPVKTAAITVTHDGQTHTLREWSEITGIPTKTIDKRLRNGWSAEDALGHHSLDSYESWEGCEKPWSQDHFARTVVAMHPDGMTCEEVGAYMGISWQRVQQLEERALERLRKQPGALEALAHAIELQSMRKTRVYPESIAWGTEKEAA